METTKWTLDQSHSELQFKVKHLMITTVTGNFNEFNASVEASDDQFSDAKISFDAKIDSINTRNNDRDQHLKSPDFFEAEKYPSLSFKSTSVEKSGSDFSIVGDLTIRDVTKSIKLNAEFGGIATDPWGNTKAGFTFDAKINRTDFGLTWNSPLAAGGVMVSEEVKIVGEIQFVKQA